MCSAGEHLRPSSFHPTDPVVNVQALPLKIMSQLNGKYPIDYCYYYRYQLHVGCRWYRPCHPLESGVCHAHLEQEVRSKISSR